jgi:hypothetical protein
MNRRDPTPTKSKSRSARIQPDNSNEPSERVSSRSMNLTSLDGVSVRLPKPSGMKHANKGSLLTPLI